MVKRLLSRIRQITGVDLEDPDVCLHLLLSYALLRTQKQRDSLS